MMKKSLVACLALAMVLAFSASFSVAAEESPVVTPMYQLSDLGIGPETSADEIAAKAAALMELAGSIQALNEQRLEELDLQAVKAKADAAKAKEKLNMMKEQNKQLAAQSKVLGLKLQIAIIEADNAPASAPAEGEAVE